MAHSTTLPVDLKTFPLPTLVVVADHVHARTWRVHDGLAEETGSPVLPRERKTDDEGTPSSAPSEFHSEEERLKHFAKLLASHITTSLRAREADGFALAAPADLLRLVLDHLPANLQEKSSGTIAGDVIQEPIIKILERFTTA